MPASDDYEGEVTDSQSPTAVPSLQDADIISNHNAAPPLSHAIPAPIETPDIEHVFVQDDPREWSRARKAFTLAVVACGALILTLGSNIYYPAINNIQEELHATNQEISLTLGLFVLIQGITPLLWSAMSEIQGRKLVYLISITMVVVSCVVAGMARSIRVLIGMRVIQASGSGAVLTLGAATLADIYEPHERGTAVGIYYAAPLIGPSVAPLIGGVLTQLLSWRATFYCVAIFAGLSLLSLLFFRDTFRRERSVLYQNALRRRANAGQEEKQAEGELKTKRIAPVRLSMRDVNPITPLIAVLRRRNNLTILLPSGLLFGFSYCITYTVVRTFAAAPYNYGALDVGLVLISYGIGCVAGSLLGGRWSDRILAKSKAANGGHSRSEDRLRSTIPMLPVLPLALIAYGWMAEKKVHVAGPCIMLFAAGVSSLWIFSSALAYLVDANAGRSSTAVASSSFARGVMAFVGAEIAVPLQDALGDGGLYTLWAGVLVLAEGMILLAMVRGSQWREEAEGTERQSEQTEPISPIGEGERSENYDTGKSEGTKP